VPTARVIARIAAAVFFTAAGVMHFARPTPYLKIMPPFIPAPLMMVYFSGAAEIGGGIGLTADRLRRMAGWGLAALLIAVFPANIYMATAHVQVTANPVPGWLLWGRLALQPPMIWWVVWCSKAN
jgi:uncharacterized membrane protein